LGSRENREGGAGKNKAKEFFQRLGPPRGTRKWGNNERTGSTAHKVQGICNLDRKKVASFISLTSHL
jgi:hypothetical protein